MNIEVLKIKRSKLEEIDRTEIRVSFMNGLEGKMERSVRGIFLLEPELYQEGLKDSGNSAYIHTSAETIQIPIDSIKSMLYLMNGDVRTQLIVDEYRRNIYLTEEQRELQNGRS